MTYKTGEVPQLGDSVMGELDGKPARAIVISVRETRVLLQRRAAYEGRHKPLQYEHAEVPSEDFALVYRHKAAPVEAEPAPMKKGKKK